MVATILAAVDGDVTKAGKAIESVTRQPEMREEITSIQWLGFALTEAVVFYGLLGSILAYVLV